MARTTTLSDAVEQLLGEGCARNAPAELLYEGNDGTTRVGRVRILELTEEEILADRPLYMGGGDEIPTGADITVHVTLNGARYQFDSVIEPGRRIVQLNARQKVPGVALRRPTTITDSQRRSAMRLSLASFDPVSVDMVAPHPDVLKACAIDAKLIPGWLVDVSVGGVSVLIDRSVLSSAYQDERYFLTFVLPTDAQEFLMLGSVRHARVVQSSDSLRIGFSFQPWHGPSFTHDQRRLSRSVAELERQLLRRRK